MEYSVVKSSLKHNSLDGHDSHEKIQGFFGNYTNENLNDRISCFFVTGIL